MNLFDRYLLREWLKMLGLLLAATMGLLLMASLYDDFRDLIQVGASATEIALYFGMLMPSYLSVVLPLSMLLSLLFVLGKLHRNNELTAVRAAGLNIFSTTRSLWLAGVVFCGVSLLLNSRVVPWSVEASASLLQSFKLRAEAKSSETGVALGLVTSVAFDNQRDNRMWFINRYSRSQDVAYGVSVSEMDVKRREKTRILAREGRFDSVARAWTFKDGREMWFDAEAGELQRSVAFKEKTVPHFREDPTLMLLITARPKDLSFNQLQRITEYFSADNNPKVIPYEVRYYSLLAETIGPLIIIAIAIPFAVSGVRVNPAVGVSKSIGLFFLYYILVTLATLVGNNGLLDPMWAAAIPNLAMTGFATYLFGRMR